MLLDMHTDQLTSRWHTTYQQT